MEEVVFLYGFSLIPFGLFNVFSLNLYEFGATYIMEGKFDRVLLRPLSSLFQVVFDAFRIESLQEVVVGLVVIVWASRRLQYPWHALDILLLAFFALCGGLGTAHNAAAMDYLVANNVPHVWPATGTTALAVPLKKNIYAVQLNYTTEATLATQYALDTMGTKKIAVFYQNDAFGKEGLDAIQAEIKKRGLPAATGVSYETADTNFSAQALKLQTSGADTVIIYAVPKPGGSIIAEMGKIGYAPKLLSSSVINDPAIFQLAGTAINGMLIEAYLPAFDDTSNPKIVEYQAFMAKYAPKEQIGGFTESGYTYGQVFIEALKRAGKELTREGFIANLDQMKDFTGSLVPSLSYSPTDHAGVKAAYFQAAKDGKFVTVTGYITLK